MIIDDKLVQEALERIARTPDGRIFHLGLQRALMALSPSPESGALQVFEGGRRFAAQIKAHMDKGLEGKASSDDDRERPIIFTVKPVAVAGPRGARRRVSE